MNIPEKVKIGGKVYRVEITDKLDSGADNASGEILYRDLLIRICPQAQMKMEADLLHEIIHAILEHLGYSEQNEKEVDEMAQSLYMVIQDNPEIFAPAEYPRYLTQFLGCPFNNGAGGEGEPK